MQIIDSILEWFFMVRVNLVWRKDKQNWAASIKRGIFGKRHSAIFGTYQEALDWVKAGIPD